MKTRPHLSKDTPTLETHQQNWEDLGQVDPMWAVLSDPTKKNNKWNEVEFYKTGEVFVADILKKARKLGAPKSNFRALDFGCGLGRLTVALSEHFTETVGVDISTSMLEKARLHCQKANIPESKCRFVHNSSPDLKIFEDNSFDFVGTYIVLQHIPDPEAVATYIQEFVRILRPGGLLYFQIPTQLAMVNRIQMKRRAYGLLRNLGVSKDFLFHRLGLHPIFYNYTPANRVSDLLGSCQILQVESESAAEKAVVSSTYFVTK